MLSTSTIARLVVDGDLNNHTRLDVDGGDLLDSLGGGVEVDDTLVDAHLEAVPGVGTLTARGLARHDAQGLGGHADGPLAQEALVLGTLDEIGAHLLEGLHVARGEVDADLVDARLLSLEFAGLVVISHCVMCWGTTGRSTGIPM